jgi:hypothetical protein
MNKVYFGDEYKKVYEKIQGSITVLRSLDRIVDKCEQKDLYKGDVDLVYCENGR